MKIYLVGGAIRDQLLGHPVQERDWVVVGATPQQLLDLGYQAVGKDFPVFLHPETKEEYALARTERKTGKGYTGFSCYAAPDVRLEEDLRRRDLTINAMAQDASGQIIDPYQGQEDLKRKVLRHVSPAFVEDPLRVLRVARFAARFAPLGFSIAAETLNLMQEIVAQGELEHLAPERVWQELLRALHTQQPRIFFGTLRQCGALAVLLPEVDALFGVPQPPQHHPEIDTGLHAMLVLDQATQLSAAAEVRFAALVHDVGKALTPKQQWPSHINHENKSVPLITALCQRLKVPNSFKDLALLVAKYHTHCHRALELRPDTLFKLLQNLDVFRRPERLQPFLLACEADARGRTGFEIRPYPQPQLIAAAFQAAGAVKAEALIAMGLQGKQLGEKLQQTQITAIKHCIIDFKARLT